MNDLFQQASRLKLRFNSPKGMLTIEDLWDLPLTSAANKANLDDVARDLHRILKDDSEVSFVTPNKSVNTTSQLAFEVVKQIIAVRVEENAKALVAKANAEKKQQLLALIAQKETEELGGRSLDELRALANSL